MARYLDDDENPDTQILYESKTHGNRYYSPTPSPAIRTPGYADTAGSKGGSQTAANGIPMNSIIKRTHAALFGGSDPPPTPPPVMSDFGEVEILEVATPQPLQSTKTPSATSQSGAQSKHTCVFPTCSRYTHAFGTAKDMRRHIINVHHLTEDEAAAKIAERDSGTRNRPTIQAQSPVQSSAIMGGGEGSAMGSNQARQPREAAYTCIFGDCPRHEMEFSTRNHLKRHLQDVHKLSEDEVLIWMPKRPDKDDETGLQAPPFVSEKSASENGFASSSKDHRFQEPRPVTDLRCLLKNCPGHAGYYSSLKNLKRHWHDVHKLSHDEIASRVAEREKAEFGSEEETAVPILDIVVASTPEALPKRKKVREAVHKCVFKDCQRSSEGFGERYDLKRHLSTVHKMSTEDAAKAVAEHYVRREDRSKQSNNVVLGMDLGSNSGEVRNNENAPQASSSAIRISGSNKALLEEYRRESPSTTTKLVNEINKRGEYSLRTDKGNKADQRQFSDDQDDAVLYPETINLPENRTSACGKIQSMDIVRKINLRPGKVLRGLAKGQANLESVMGQQRGEVMEGEDACRHCQLSRGPYEECVVVKGMLNHSCTNCHYNSEGSRCSFRPTDEDEGLQYAMADIDELANEDSPAIDANKDQLIRKRRSIEETSIDEDEAAVEDQLEPYTPQYYTAQYARISEEERLQEESVLHMRLSCLAQARIQSLSTRRRDSEQYEDGYSVTDSRPKGKRARRSH